MVDKEEEERGNNTQEQADESVLPSRTFIASKEGMEIADDVDDAP